MSISPRKELDGLVPSTHGGLDYAELERLGLRPKEITDFSVCSNPFGPPASVRNGLADTAIEQYPDSDSWELRRALACQLGTAPDNIIVGNGSTELIRLAALAYFNPGDNVALIEPDFREYETAALISGAKTVRLPIGAENGFRLRIDELINLLKQAHARALYLSNPHNPTGQYLAKEDLQTVLERAPQCLVILDEAYVSFVQDAWPSVSLIGHDDLLILHSMTKEYTIPGLRLGYAVSNTRIIEALRKVRPPWNVSAAAQRAGLLALQERDFLPKSLRWLNIERDNLITRLNALGLRPVPTRANFFLVEVGDARDFRQRLLSRKLLVRDCTSFGLPGYVRISPRTPAENARLISVLEEMAALGDI